MLLFVFYDIADRSNYIHVRTRTIGVKGSYQYKIGIRRNPVVTAGWLSVFVIRLERTGDYAGDVRTMTGFISNVAIFNILDRVVVCLYSFSSKRILLNRFLGPGARVDNSYTDSPACYALSMQDVGIDSFGELGFTYLGLPFTVLLAQTSSPQRSIGNYPPDLTRGELRKLPFRQIDFNRLQQRNSIPRCGTNHCQVHVQGIHIPA